MLALCVLYVCMVYTACAACLAIGDPFYSASYQGPLQCVPSLQLKITVYCGKEKKGTRIVRI